MPEHASLLSHRCGVFGRCPLWSSYDFFMIFLGLSSYSGVGQVASNRLRHATIFMSIPDETGSALVLILVVLTFSFLVFLARGSWSPRQQTGAWLLFGVLFFSVCSLLFRNASFAVGMRPPSASPGMVDVDKVTFRRPLVVDLRP